MIISDQFPSPLGEMGLSIKRGTTCDGWEYWFPSPLGEMGLSIALTTRSRRANSHIRSVYQYLTHMFSILK